MMEVHILQLYFLNNYAYSEWKYIDFGFCYLLCTYTTIVVPLPKLFMN